MSESVSRVHRALEVFSGVTEVLRVLATGFRVDRFVRPMEVVGARGVMLDDVWAGGPFAYMTLAVPDFPNFYMLNGPNGPVGNFSLIEVAELQMSYVPGRRVVSFSGSAAVTFAERGSAPLARPWRRACRCG